MSTTMKEVFVKSQTPAWHAWRACGLGGSDAPIIAADAGLCKPAPWMKSIEHLWKVKTGRISDISEPNFGMLKGIRAEPKARAAYISRTGVHVRPKYGEMTVNPVVRSSFDGLDLFGDVITEIKYGSQYQHDLAKEGEVVQYYRPQLAHQALTAWGMPEEWKSEHRCVFVSYIPESDDLAFVDRPAFEYRELAEKLFKVEMEFWKRVQNDMEPVSVEWREAAFAFLDAKAQIDALTKMKAEAEAALISLAGANDKKAGAGVSVTKQVRKGVIDYSKLLSELTSLTPEQIDAYRKADSETTVVRAVSVK